mmetsp:Transcript_17256/g.60281  ORF Transcript_17256/g.60281 Transcript_17256/m.60281 type:complete len:229 (-) Transcript_17256:93-779(-)
MQTTDREVIGDGGCACKGTPLRSHFSRRRKGGQRPTSAAVLEAVAPGKAKSQKAGPRGRHAEREEQRPIARPQQVQVVPRQRRSGDARDGFEADESPEPLAREGRNVQEAEEVRGGENLHDAEPAQPRPQHDSAVARCCHCRRRRRRRRRLRRRRRRRRGERARGQSDALQQAFRGHQRRFLAQLVLEGSQSDLSSRTAKAALALARGRTQAWGVRNNGRRHPTAVGF